MASKTKYNIVVGAKLDPTNNLSEQIQSAISKTTYKINIDVAHLTEQINKALKASSFDIGKITSRGGGSSGSGGSGEREYKGELNPETRVIHSLSTKTYLDEENNEVKELISGYDALGHKVTELNRIYQENNETVRQRLSSTEEEGSLLNKNAETYDSLNAKVTELSSNIYANKERVDELNRSLEQIKSGSDEFSKGKEYKELSAEIKQVTTDARQLETQTKKNQQTFSQLSNRLNNLKSNGQITTKQFEKLRQELEETKNITDQTQLQAKLKEVGQAMSDSSKHAMTFGQMLKTAYEKFAIWSIATVSWYAMVRAMKDVVKQTIEIDKAFTRLQMITLASREEIDKMKSSYIALAKEMKVSLGTVTDAAETWLRTGMNAAEANTALQASTILSKDAFMEGADAASVLIAAQKAYKLETNDLIGVVDKLTTLDTKAATTAQDLGEALALSGASASAAGFSMDKYLALLATSSEVTQQSASVIGNAWKTLTARLRKVGAGASLDDEGEDISDVDKVLKQYGINLREVSNGMTNMENVVTALGEKWAYLNGEQKAQIATAVAGTRQQNIFIATMENYDRVLELTAESTNSAGSAMDKFNVYAESTEAKIQDLKTAWTELADATLKSDTVEWFITFGKECLELTTQAGGLIPVIVALGAALLSLKIGGGAGLAIGSIVGAGVLAYQAEQIAVSNRIKKMQLEVEATEKVLEENDKLSKSISENISQYVYLQSVQEKTEEQTKQLDKATQSLAKSLNTTVSEIKNTTTFTQQYFSRQTEIYQAQIDLIEHQLSVLESKRYGIQSGGSSKEQAAFEEEIISLTEKLKKYKTALADIPTVSEIIGNVGEWERSEAGAKKMLSVLNDLERVLYEIGNEETRNAVAETLSKIREDVEEFRSIDFVLTEYYDKRLEDLKEQKELEDELAKQKENEEKIANAELKVQETALEVEKKRAALAAAKEKRIQVFRMGKGLVYEEDTESIANAQEDLNKSLENYANAQKDLANTIASIEGTLTAQLISAVERLEEVYSMGLVGEKGQELRDFFQTKENLEKYKSFSQEEQLAFLLEFLSPEDRERAIAMWGLDEKNIEAVGNRVRENVFGGGTGGVSTATGYQEAYVPAEKKIEAVSSSFKLPYRATSSETEEAKLALENADYETFSKYLPSMWNEDKKKEYYYKYLGSARTDSLSETDEISNSDLIKYFTSALSAEKESTKNVIFRNKELLFEFIGKGFGKFAEEYRGQMLNLPSSTQEAYYKAIRQGVLGYHTGGIVGQPAFSSDNEMYAKLLKGEIVLPQTKFNDIINKVQGVTNNDDSTVISIGNITLPSVTDTDSFVNELQRIGYSR